jgi:hypothetical protein
MKKGANDPTDEAFNPCDRNPAGNQRSENGKTDEKPRRKTNNRNIPALNSREK